MFTPQHRLFLALGKQNQRLWKAASLLRHLLTSEEPAGDEDLVRWSALWKTVSLRLIFFFPITKLKIFFPLPGQMAFPHNPKHTGSLTVMKKLLCLYYRNNVEAPDDLK